MNDNDPITTPSCALGGRDNNFNFIRLVLASTVILSHSAELVDGNPHRELFHRIFPTIIGGGLAVCGFFLLSGFLIIQSWHRSARLGSFLKKRVLRIYPAFVVAFLISSFIFGPLGSHSATEYFTNFHPKGFLRRLVMLWAPDSDLVFVGFHYPSLNGAMWTISNEFRCYLLVPLLGMIGFIKNRLAWLLVSVGVAVYFLVHLAAPVFPYPFMSSLIWENILPELPQFFPYLTTYFMIGGCFYLFRDKIVYKGRWALVVAPLVAIGFLINEHGAQIVLMTGGAYLLFWFAFLQIPQLDFFKYHADVSYGTYLYGWPVQSLLIWYFPHIGPWELFSVTLPVSLGLGWLSWHIIELPFLRIKPKPGLREVDTLPSRPTVRHA